MTRIIRPWREIREAKQRERTHGPWCPTLPQWIRQNIDYPAPGSFWTLPVVTTELVQVTAKLEQEFGGLWWRRLISMDVAGQQLSRAGAKRWPVLGCDVYPRMWIIRDFSAARCCSPSYWASKLSRIFSGCQVEDQPPPQLAGRSLAWNKVPPGVVRPQDLPPEPVTKEQRRMRLRRSILGERAAAGPDLPSWL
jgi:hypothetical protein